MGVDGKKGNIPIQVKQSESVGRNVVDNFKAAVARFDNKLFTKAKEQGNTIGYLISFSFSKGAIQEVARLRNEERVYIELKEVEDIVVPLAKKPKLKVVTNDLGLNEEKSSGDRI